MITPIFKLEQDDEFILISIRAPYANVKNAEIVYEDQTFLFICKPYFLRLFLTNEVIASDQDEVTGSISYDFNTNTFLVKVPKKNKAEIFSNLDMLSELLKPQKKLHAGRLIEEVGQGKDSNKETSLGESTAEIFAVQSLVDDDADKVPNDASSIFGYGYGWKRHGVLLKFQEEIGELIDLKQPDLVPIDERAEMCQEYDKEHFKEEHYLADLFEPDGQLLAAVNFRIDPTTHLILNDLDREQLKNLQVHQLDGFGLQTLQRKISYSLIDLLCAYLYDLRTTDGEHCVESGWTIRKLSPSLSFLVQWQNVNEAINGFLRRSLVFPIYRNWQLALNVLDDVEVVFKQGRASVLKCLLQIRRIFNSSAGDCYYLFNQLFVDDLCLWIQSTDESVIADLKEQLKLVRKRTEKESMDLDLDYLEMQAGLESCDIDIQSKSKLLDSDDESVD